MYCICHCYFAECRQFAVYGTDKCSWQCLLCVSSVAAEPENPTQPAMMTFKQFLSSQDDNITDEEAIKKFGDYKVEFRKQQINEFFVQHKDEEW